MANLWRYNADTEKWVKVSEEDPLPVDIQATDTINVTATVDNVKLEDSAGTNKASIDSSGALKVVEKTPLTSIEVSSFPALDDSTDSVTAVNQPAASLGQGVKNVTAAFTPEALATSTACKYVIVQAREANTSKIAVGGSDALDATVTTGTGILLEAGDSVTLDVDNLADVYIDSRVNGEGVVFTYGVA